MTEAAGRVRTLVELCLKGAERFGGKTALTDRGGAVGYEELAERALAFAGHLRQKGLDPGHRVLLLLENSPEYVVALFGCLAAELVVAPTNPDTKRENIEFLADNSGARGLIARERVHRRLGLATERPEVQVLMGRDYNENAEAFFGGRPLEPPSTDPERLALILYTSGTTGRPKGVMLSHRNLMANTRSIAEYLKLTENDSIVNVLPFFYSFGNSVLMTHLAVGGTVHIENRFTYPAVVVETMQQLQPTGFSGVPSTFYILLNKTDFLERPWPCLRYLSQAGGGMRTGTIRQLREAMPGVEIYIMYGQTEGSARLSYLKPELLERKLGSIGKGLPGVELRLVDERGESVGPGEVGEITARGDNIMTGYLNQPEATAQVLRDGWLWTGDMARIDEDGYFYIVSRKSDFIKTGSYRVSPGEVEEVVAERPEVEDVAACGIEDAMLGEAIMVAVVCPSERFDPVAIREHCLARLPLYKVPRQVVRIDAVPRTASGKKRYVELRERFTGSRYTA